MTDAGLILSLLANALDFEEWFAEADLGEVDES